MKWPTQLPLLTIVLAMACICPTIACGDQTALAANNWKQDGWPLLEHYCLDCHNEDNQEAEIDLSVLATLQGVQEHSDLATRVVSIVRFGAMPPEDADVPDSDTRRQLADGLDELVFHGACDLRPRPGRTTARRLNRAEYNNAIRDLFGLDLKPANQFPADEVGAGFDNNADVLSLSPMLMEKYLTAAESVTQQILVDPDSLPQVNRTFADATLNITGESVAGRFGQRYLTQSGLAWVECEVPVSGEYTVEVRASASQEIKGERLTTIYDAKGVLRGVLHFKNDSDEGGDDYDRFKIRLSQGKHRFYLEPTDYSDAKEKELLDREWKIGETINPRIAILKEDELKKSVLKPGTSISPARKIDKQHFAMRIRSIVVRGPSDWDRADLPASQQKILLGGVPSQRDGRYIKVESRAKKTLQPLLRQAFRREVSDEDVAPYVDVVAEVCKRGESYYKGLQTAIAAMLVSPRFLFRIEMPESDEDRQRAAEGDSIPLSSTQLASRLSFFLWSSLPDTALLDAAKRNELKNRSKRKYHVDRLLDGERSRTIGERFVRQWFALGNLDGRDLTEFMAAGQHPVDGITTDTLAQETEALFLHLLGNNLPITDLLVADYTFVNRPLAQWYGIKTDGLNDEFVKRPIASDARRGILGHAGVLFLTSYPTRNSPVQRGKWILENILGTPPPEAPPGVPGLEETKMASADATLREQLELHRADPGCASCHRVMDSLGFGLEEFDHFGRLRSEQDPARQDAGGELPGGRKFLGANQLSRLLAESESRKLAETAVRRMMTFAIGRELRPGDRCFVEAILDTTAKDNYRVKDILYAVIESPPFLNHQAEMPDHVATKSDSNLPKETQR